MRVPKLCAAPPFQRETRFATSNDQDRMLLAEKAPQIGGDPILDTELGAVSLTAVNSYIRAMTTGTVRTTSSERSGARSRLYWLDIDVNFKDIMRQQRIISNHQISRVSPPSLQYSILTGVGTVANALSVGEEATTFNSFKVDVAAFIQTNEIFEAAELNRSAKMIWNDVDVQSPRLEIYVQPKMLRHLVELYVTKRIDMIIISMKIAVMPQPTADTGPGYELLPVLDTDQRLYFRRTQCELLSVHASLASEKSARQS
jgi:hypothetical protein